MAETKRMTADEVVSYLLEEEELDFLRESLTWVVQQLMEAEVSELVALPAVSGRRKSVSRIATATGRGRGRRARGSSSSRSRRSEGAATSRASWSRASARSRPW